MKKEKCECACHEKKYRWEECCDSCKEVMPLKKYVCKNCQEVKTGLATKDIKGKICCVVCSDILSEI
jgi:hypothetical protein